MAFFVCHCIKIITLIAPCCGSGGFFLASQAFLADPKNYTLDREMKNFLKDQTFYGNEIVPATFKTALMNLYLHNIGDIYGNVPITLGDALLTNPGWRVDYVLTNPPFGKKSSITFTNEEGEQEDEDLVYNRQDFRTNIHFTLKKNPMSDADLEDFIRCYNSENRHNRSETWAEENPDGRWRRFTIGEILERDKTSLDIF